MAETTDYALTEAEAALLLTVTRDAMSSAGRLGGSVGAGAAGGAGGSLGGRWGARLTKPRTAVTTVDAWLTPDSAREFLRTAIADHGYLIDDPNEAGDGSVWGVVMSGAMNMAPAMVRAHVEPSRAGRCQVQIRATGREGLIKQRIGARAADRIAGAVSSS